VNLLLFRRQIETLVGHLAGEYVLANGFVTPAISAREGSESLDENTSVQGLEIVITTSAETRDIKQYEGIPVAGYYIVSLIQWSTETDVNIQTAKALIESAYGVKGVGINVPEDVGPTMQAQIKIQSSTYLQSGVLMIAP
jgi:hypothetical protein